MAKSVDRDWCDMDCRFCSTGMEPIQRLNGRVRRLYEYLFLFPVGLKLATKTVLWFLYRLLIRKLKKDEQN